MAEPLPSDNDDDCMRLLPGGSSGILARLEFLARAKKQGPISGRHVSPNKGFSVVFAEHRPYTPGDDIRDLDWRVYAKADKYYIRQYIEETNLRATMVVDCSGSMKYQGSLASPVDGKIQSKFEYARHMAAALTYLMVKQQDAVGLVTFDDKIRSFIRAASRPSQVRLVLDGLNRSVTGGDTRLAGVLHEVAERIPQRGLVMIFSDCFDAVEDIVNAFHHFKYRSHEVILFHIMAEEELTFPFIGSQEFRDLEGEAKRLRVDPGSVRNAYLERVRAHIDRLEAACGQLQADYVPVSTKQFYFEALAKFLETRRR
ncbi:MAG: hypothetical protein JWM59_1043 [Verrucomicrobiales bacterium]|nr:hypothetical protein [Verrucomicrobiales bacterium]